MTCPKRWWVSVWISLGLGGCSLPFDVGTRVPDWSVPDLETSATPVEVDPTRPRPPEPAPRRTHPPTPEEIGAEAFPIPPPPVIPEEEAIEAARRQRDLHTGQPLTHPRFDAPSLVPLPGAGTGFPPLPTLGGSRNHEENSALGLLARPAPEARVAAPLRPAPPPVQLQPAPRLEMVQATPTGTGAAVEIPAPVDRRLRPRILFLPFRGAPGQYVERLLGEGIEAFLRQQGEGDAPSEPLQRPSLPSPVTVEGASALHRMGVGYLVMGTLENEPGGLLTLELYRPPQSGVVWASSAVMKDPSRPEGALQQVLEKLLARLRQEHDHLDPLVLHEAIPFSNVEPLDLTEQGALPLSARQIKRLAKPTPPSSAPSPAARPDADYEVQTGAFQNRDAAAAEVAILAQRGYPARIARRQDKDGTWYLVRVGAFATRTEAVQQADELRKRWLLNAFPAQRMPEHRESSTPEAHGK